MSHCKDCDRGKCYKVIGSFQGVKYFLCFFSFLILFVSVTLFVACANSAEKVARIVFSPKESLILERLDPTLLLCRQGPFHLEIPITRLSWVKVIKRRSLELRFQGGGVCVAKVPKFPITGEWSHGPINQGWRTLSRIEILRPSRLRKRHPDDRSAIIRAGKQGVMRNVLLRKDKLLKIRKGGFLISIPWDRIEGVKRINSGKIADVSFLDGGVLGGDLPKYVEGDWQGASMRVPGLQVETIRLLGETGKSEIKKKPLIKRQSKKSVWGVIEGDSGVHFDIIGPPEFDGPFSFWNEIRQIRDRSYLPLAQNPSGKDRRTILIAADMILKIKKNGSEDATRSEVTLQSGRRYSGWVGSRRLSAKTSMGRIEIPLSRISRIRQRSEKPQRPSGSSTLRAVVRLLSGENIQIEEPALFYERKLRPDW